MWSIENWSVMSSPHVILWYMSAFDSLSVNIYTQCSHRPEFALFGSKLNSFSNNHVQTNPSLDQMYIQYDNKITRWYFLLSNYTIYWFEWFYNLYCVITHYSLFQSFSILFHSFWLETALVRFFEVYSPMNSIVILLVFYNLFQPHPVFFATTAVCAYFSYAMLADVHYSLGF